MTLHGLEMKEDETDETVIVSKLLRILSTGWCKVPVEQVRTRYRNLFPEVIWCVVLSCRKSETLDAHIDRTEVC
jgi:hypothetical protein